MAPRTRTLLTPGNVPSADTPVETLLRSGMALSEQAFTLLNAIERSDDRRSAQRA